MKVRKGAPLAAAVAVVAAVAAVSACSTRGGSVTATTHQMGEHVQTGPLVYTVLEVQWVNQLNNKLPKDQDGKFAVVRLSVTNAGNSESAVPLLQFIDDKGTSHMELAEVDGVEEWLGILRTVNPAETIQGNIVFDVPAKNYKLRITDGADPDKERTALISIPLRLEQRNPVSVDQPNP
jgi:hypothetical protein